MRTRIIEQTIYKFEELKEEVIEKLQQNEFFENGEEV